MFEKEIESAVNWWANTLMGDVKHDNGARDLNSLLSCTMADLLKKTITEQQIEVFKNELKSLLVKELYENRKRRQSVTYLSCDYNPCCLLEEAAEKAEISEFNFPYKTHMEIREGEVIVSAGYREPYQTIYSKEANNER